MGSSPGQSGVDLWALTDLCTPWCVHVVATLRIAHHVEAGISDIAGLAEASGCDRDALHSVLGHLVGKGVFEEPAPGTLALNEAARGLLDPGARLGLDLDGIGGRMAHAWGTLLTYVRTGKPAYYEVFGRPFWEDLEAHPEMAAEFDALIGPPGHGTPNPHFEITGGWDSVKTVVDVGGGTGAMLAAILHARPGIRGILVDQPGTVARSVEIFRDVAERVTTVGQSFFDPLPPGGDLYLLKGILNDWPDPDATAILLRCAEAAGQKGRVVVLGGLAPDNSPQTLMIEAVLLGGKQRTVAEMAALARQVGLEVITAGRQSSGHFVVEFRPRGDSEIL